MRVRSRRWTALCPPARFAVVAQSRGGHASPCLPHRPRRARRGVRRGLDGYTVLEQFVRTYAAVVKRKRTGRETQFSAGAGRGPPVNDGNPATRRP